MTTRTTTTMTSPLSPLVLTAPLAAAVLLAATGWATGEGTPATASPPPSVVVERKTADPALKAVRQAVSAERHDIHRLERTLDRARAELRQARDQAAVAASAGWSSSPSVSVSTSGSSSSGSSGSGSSGSSGGSSGSGPAPASPPADTTTGGS